MLSIHESFLDSAKNHLSKHRNKYLGGLGIAALAGGAYGLHHLLSPNEVQAASSNSGSSGNNVVSSPKKINSDSTVDPRYRNEPKNGRTYFDYNPKTGNKEPVAVDMNKRQITPKEVAHIRPNAEHARYGEVWVSKPDGGKILLDPPNVIMKAFGNKQYQAAIVTRFLDNLDYYKAHNQDHRYDDVIARGEKIIRLGK